MAAAEHPIPIVPRKFAGLWIAWNRSKTEIVASGRTLDEARSEAESVGEFEPVLAKAPRADVRFLGTAR